MSNLAFENIHVRVEHSLECKIPGYVIIFPKRDVYSMGEMTESELKAFSETLAMTHSVINNTINPERIYTISLGELLPTIHFHIFPRTKALLDAYHQATGRENEPTNGTLLFDWARKTYRNAPLNAETYQKSIENISQAYASTL